MERFTNKLVWILERLVMAMLAIDVLLVILQVFTRYVIKSPLSWTEQVARYLFIWMMLLGIPIMFHRKIFMAFDLLQDALSLKGKRILSFIITVSICIFALFFLKSSLHLCLSTRGRRTAGIEIPLYFIYGAQPVSALFLFIVMLNQLINDLSDWLKPSKDNAKRVEGAN